MSYTALAQYLSVDRSAMMREIFFFVFSYCNIHDDLLLYLSSSTFRPFLRITPSSERFLISRIMNVTVRKYEEKDLPDLIRIWNEVVEDGVAFPQ